MLVSTAEAQAPEFKHLHGGRVGNVFFVNDARGYSAEDGARIRRSDDGGQTWVHQKTPNNIREELGDVFFINNDTGWAATTKGVILGTVDGGANWAQINLSPPALLNAFDDPAKINTIFMFPDGANGWAGGDDGALWQTDDGGVNWIAFPNPPEGFEVDSHSGDPEDAYKIRFWDADTGYMVADWGNAYRYELGAWQRVDVNQMICNGTPGPDHPNLELWDFDFGSSTTQGLMSGGVGIQNPFTFQTSDGGLTWTLMSCFAVEPNPGTSDCTPATTYGVTRMGAWPGGVAAGYDSLLLVNELGTPATFDACLCGPVGTGPCATSGASWVRGANQGQFDPPLFSIARIGTTSKVCTTGTFGVIRVLDTAGA
jgi:photosystem II stability/assembly factor-like uncharacterized protein